jgi:hypothetical protein
MTPYSLLSIYEEKRRISEDLESCEEENGGLYISLIFMYEKKLKIIFFDFLDFS